MEEFPKDSSHKNSDRINIEDVIHLDFFQQIFKRNPDLSNKALMSTGVLGRVNIGRITAQMRKSVVNSSNRRHSTMSRLSRNKSTASPKSSVIRFVASTSDKEGLAKTVNAKQLKQ
jgi:hypothetical protein